MVVEPHPVSGGGVRNELDHRQVTRDGTVTLTGGGSEHLIEAPKLYAALAAACHCAAASARKARRVDREMR
jgi:hypothetical protein